MSAPRRTGGLLDRKLLIVSGKGGTGKTSVAAALARLGNRLGKRVLACEVDAKGSLAACLGAAGPVGFEPSELQPDLFAMEMNTEASLREYLRVYLRVPFTAFPVAGLGPLARTFDFVADAAPGVKEILTIGKLAWEVKERNYDLVVVDAPASGHVGSLLDAPGALRTPPRRRLLRRAFLGVSAGYGKGASGQVRLVCHAPSDRIRDPLSQRLTSKEAHHAHHQQRRQSLLLSKRVASGGRGYPSETHVRRGDRVVHGDKELLEKLGRNDLCPCGSGHRFQEVLFEVGRLRRQRAELLPSVI